MINSLIRALFPDRCFVCGALGEQLCATCAKTICSPHTDHCPRCGQAGVFPRSCPCGPDLPAITALFSLTPALRTFLHQIKYKNQKQLTGLIPTLLKTNQIKTLSLIARTPGAILVPIPLHRRRERERGFNQSRLIAQEISQITSAPCAEILERTRETQSQAKTKRRPDREKNTKGAFTCTTKLPSIKNTQVILVDDVVTSGSTMAAAASALMRGGAHTVWGLALAQEDWRAQED